MAPTRETSSLAICRAAIEGDVVRIRSVCGEEHGDALVFSFSGTVSGDGIAGTLDMGEYLSATWTATRRA